MSATKPAPRSVARYRGVLRRDHVGSDAGTARRLERAATKVGSLLAESKKRGSGWGKHPDPRLGTPPRAQHLDRGITGHAVYPRPWTTWSRFSARFGQKPVLASGYPTTERRWSAITSGSAPLDAWTGGVQRRDLIGGLIHEYERAA